MDTVAVVSKLKTTNGKIRWWSGPAMAQNFPFHDNLIYYMTMNPSTPKAYNKLIKCCKYFFEANPIIVAGQICDHGDYVISDIRVCSKQTHKYGNSVDNCCIIVDLEEIFCKLWVIKLLKFQGKFSPNFFSSLRTKLYHCNINEIFLWNCESIILFNDFKFLTHSVERLDFFLDVKMVDLDGKPVLLDAILAVCPKIQYFQHDFLFSTDFSILSASTLKDISKLQNLSNLKEFKLFNIPEIFDIQDVSNFLTKKLINTTVKLRFNRGVSEEYKVQLNTIRQKIREEQIQNRHLY